MLLIFTFFSEYTIGKMIIVLLKGIDKMARSLPDRHGGPPLADLATRHFPTYFIFFTEQTQQLSRFMEKVINPPGLNVN